MPTHDEEDSPRRSVDELRRVARYQRWIIASVLAQIGVWIAFLVLGLAGAWNGYGSGFDFAVVLTVIFGCVGGIYSFLIYWSIRNPVWATVMGLASIPPAMGILTLTVVNGLATRTLTTNGVEVGMFGANATNIKEDRWLDEDEDW
jgi:hypothetical protein